MTPSTKQPTETHRSRNAALIIVGVIGAGVWCLLTVMIFSYATSDLVGAEIDVGRWIIGALAVAALFLTMWWIELMRTNRGLSPSPLVLMGSIIVLAGAIAIMVLPMNHWALYGIPVLGLGIMGTGTARTTRRPV